MKVGSKDAELTSEIPSFSTDTKIRDEPKTSFEQEEDDKQEFSKNDARPKNFDPFKKPKRAKSKEVIDTYLAETTEKASKASTIAEDETVIQTTKQSSAETDYTAITAKKKLSKKIHHAAEMTEVDGKTAQKATADVRDEQLVIQFDEKSVISKEKPSGTKKILPAVEKPVISEEKHSLTKKVLPADEKPIISEEKSSVTKKIFPVDKKPIASEEKPSVAEKVFPADEKPVISEDKPSLITKVLPSDEKPAIAEEKSSITKKVLPSDEKPIIFEEKPSVKEKVLPSDEKPILSKEKSSVIKKEIFSVTKKVFPADEKPITFEEQSSVIENVLPSDKKSVIAEEKPLLTKKVLPLNENPIISEKKSSVTKKVCFDINKDQPAMIKESDQSKQQDVLYKADAAAQVETTSKQVKTKKTIFEDEQNKIEDDKDAKDAKTDLPTTPASQKKRKPMFAAKVSVKKTTKSVSVVEDRAENEKLEDLTSKNQKKLPITKPVAEVQLEKPEVQPKKPEVQPKKPEVQLEKPEVQREKPEVQLEKPEIQREKPEIQPEKPKLQREKPEVQREKPEVQREKPEIQREKPEIQREKPEVQREKPEIQREKPEVQRKKPEIQREKPEIQPEKPKLQREKPEVQREKPEIQREKPEVQREKPEVQREKPEVQREKPEVQREKPEIQREKSEIQREKPEIQREKPEIQREKPEIQPEKPEVQREKPEIQREKPEVQREKPEIQREKSELQREKPEIQREKSQVQPAELHANLATKEKTKLEVAKKIKLTDQEVFEPESSEQEISTTEKFVTGLTSQQIKPAEITKKQVKQVKHSKPTEAKKLTKKVHEDKISESENREVLLKKASLAGFVTEKTQNAEVIATTEQKPQIQHVEPNMKEQEQVVEIRKEIRENVVDVSAEDKRPKAENLKSLQKKTSVSKIITETTRTTEAPKKQQKQSELQSTKKSTVSEKEPLTTVENQFTKDNLLVKSEDKNVITEQKLPTRAPAEKTIAKQEIDDMSAELTFGTSKIRKSAPVVPALKEITSFQKEFEPQQNVTKQISKTTLITTKDGETIQKIEKITTESKSFKKKPELVTATDTMDTSAAKKEFDFYEKPLSEFAIAESGNEPIHKKSAYVKSVLEDKSRDESVSMKLEKEPSVQSLLTSTRRSKLKITEAVKDVSKSNVAMEKEPQSLTSKSVEFQTEIYGEEVTDGTYDDERKFSKLKCEFIRTSASFASNIHQNLHLFSKCFSYVGHYSK